MGKFALSGTHTYIKNLQGDVLRVIDETGATVLSYAYDPWGVPTISGDRAVAELNPCSYRSYYYDGETGYYYLQSRYYDPTIGRFLNADEAFVLMLPNNGLNKNVFQYCDNNPINNADPSGYWTINISVSTAGWIFEGIIVACVVLLESSLQSVGQLTSRENDWEVATAEEYG